MKTISENKNLELCNWVMYKYVKYRNCNCKNRVTVGLLYMYNYQTISRSIKKKHLKFGVKTIEKVVWNTARPEDVKFLFTKI